MFYIGQMNPLGCLLWTALFVWLFDKLRLYYVVAVLIIFALVYNLYKQTKLKFMMHKQEKEKNFEPEIGEVYKVCPYCENSVKRSAKVCPHCNEMIE